MLLKIINRKPILLYIFYTLVILGLAVFISNMVFSTKINKTFILGPRIGRLFDVIIFSTLFFPIFLLSRNKKIFFINEFIYVLIYYFINSIKFKILESPIRFYELRMIQEFYLTMPVTYSILASLIIIIPILLTIYNINYKLKYKNYFLLLTFPIFICLSLSASVQLEKLIYNSFIKSNLLEHTKAKKLGNFFYLYYDMLSTINQRNVNITEDDIKESLNILYNGKDINSTKARNSRNIILIAVESLEYINKYINEKDINKSSFYEKFHKLFIDSKSTSIAISEYTSNGLFELLCGFPLLKHTVLFNEALNNSLPCLPNYLKTEGYVTNAYVLDKPGTYNFASNFQKIGFDNKYFINNINIPHTQKNIRDYYLLNFVKDNFKKNYENSVTSFNLILTASTHYPYDEYKQLGLKKEVKLINSKIPNIVENYANSIYYTTKVLYEFIEEIFSIDPNTLIIITGDHPAPIMVSNTDTGLDKQGRKSLYAMSIPLIILDGKNNLITNKKQPHYSTAITISKILNMNFPLYNYNKNVYNLRFLAESDEYIKINNDELKYDKEAKALKIMFYDIFFGKKLYKKYL